MSDRDDERDIGVMGEAVLLGWAGQVGLVANRASKDERGWDYFLQFKRSPGFAGVTDSLDHLLGALECLVQVKSTDAAHTRQVKLSNWHRFCLSPLPAFFLILDYQGGTDLQAAYLVHVDKKWIGKTFKRMRELSREDREKLHLKLMRVSWAEKDRLPALNGQSLKEELERRIGKNLMAYSRRKAKWRKEVGYEGSAGRLSFTLSGDNQGHPEDMLVDFALGVRSELDVQAERFEEIRFGIAKPIPHSGRLALSGHAKPAGSARLIFIIGERRANFKCNFFSPGWVVPVVSRERLRFRYVSSFVEFIVHAATGNVDLKFNAPNQHEAVSLAELAQAFGLLTMIEDARKAQEVSPDLTLLIEQGEKSFEMKFKMTKFPEVEGIDIDLAKAVGNAWYIAKKLELDLELKASLAMLGSSALQLLACRAVLDDAPHDIGISGELKPSGSDSDADVSAQNPGDIEFGLPLVAAVFIGKTLVVASAAAHGKPEFSAPLEDGAVPYTVRPALHRFPPKIMENFTKGTYLLKEHYEQIRDWMKDKGISMPRSFLERLEPPEAVG